jgi:serine/threonine protein phosphatase 1
VLDTSPVVARSVVKRFPLNDLGRDFVVGDVHGMFDQLRLLLAQVRFEPQADRLFSVGDLVDRGPGSREALSWLGLPWFHACRGNHEQFAIDSVIPDELSYWVEHNGGGWWLQLSQQERMAFRTAFLSMPLAMEVETATGRVGIVHADIPPALAWEHFLQLLEGGHEEIAVYAIFSRYRAQMARDRPGPVPGGVTRIYCGHTPVRQPVMVDNVHFIDTGAVYALDGYEDARLTMIQFHPGPHREFGVRCA